MNQNYSLRKMRKAITDKLSVVSPFGSSDMYIIPIDIQSFCTDGEYVFIKKHRKKIYYGGYETVSLKVENGKIVGFLHEDIVGGKYTGRAWPS